MSWVGILKENSASTGSSFVSSEPLNLLYVQGLKHTQYWFPEFLYGMPKTINKK